MHWIKTTFKVLVIHGLSRNISHYRRIFVYIFCLISICFSFSYQPIKINSECQKSITISVVCENLSLIYRIISEKFSLKKSKLSTKCMGFQHLCHPVIWQFSVVPISFVVAHKELKIAQIAQINQLFKLLSSILFVPTMTPLWVYSYANEQKCKQWYQQRFAYILYRY